MFKITVEIYGVPSEATDLRKVEMQLPDGAHISDLITALKQSIPTLDKYVTASGENILTEYYAFNINGHFYTDEKNLQIHSGDRIALLSLATGG